VSGALATLVGAATHAQDIKKSRFQAQAAPVAAPDDALAWLARVRDTTATHNCWAYRIGQAYRFADDGEPAGTAGKPILAAIDGQQLDRVVVVVTRWYGGIKLGAGGLVRAYGGTAAECLRLAPRETIVARVRLRVRAEHASVAALRNALRSVDASKVAERADADGVELDVDVAATSVDALRERVRNATRGRGRVESA
jgi:uncharacterized YigZ family protein